MPRLITGTLPHRRTSRVVALLAAPAAAVALLSGCGAGQVNQTGRMVAPVSGVDINSKHGLAALRDVQIQYNSPQGYPVGATAPLSLYIANNDPGKPLILRSVTAASRQGGATLGTVLLTGGTPDVEAFPSAGPAPTASATASRGPSAIPSVTPTRRSSATPSAGSAASAAPVPSAGASGGLSAAPSSSPAGSPPALTIPANGFARLDPGHGAYLAITTITETLQPGSSALVTFTFEGEDPLQIAVPFGVPLSPAPRLTPSGGGAPAE